MAKRGLPKGTKFITTKAGFRVSQKKIKTFERLARQSNAMLRKVERYGDFFGKTKLTINKFESLAQMNAKIRQLQNRVKLGAQNYITYRQAILQRNYIFALQEAYGSKIADRVKALENLSTQEFYTLYQSNRLPAVFYWYDYEPERLSNTQQEIDEALKYIAKQ